MNKKLKIAFIHYSNEQGFALPIAVGLGLVMLLIAVTLLVRSQGDRLIASAQKDTAQSLSLSEVAVTRTLSTFKHNSDLTVSRYTPPTHDQWTSNGGSSLIGASGTNGWIPVSTFGHFKIVSYTTIPGTGVGTLEVLGTTDTDTTTLQSTNKPQKAISALEIKIAHSPPAINSPEIAINEWRRKEVP